jgi:hypothetical protein
MSRLEKEGQAAIRYLPNLAGNVRCDISIRKELTEAGVGIIESKTPREDEVPAKLTGILNNPNGEPAFTLTRAWYYWVVDGDVPLSVAEEMYKDPVGKEDVRVAGHRGCPPPKEWAKHSDKDGKKLYSLSTKLESEKELTEFENRHSEPEIKELVRKARENTRYVENPAAEAAKSVITTYHIDSQDGLNLFVNKLKTRGVIKQ